MLDLPGIQSTTKIYESQRAIVYRGIRAADSLPVIIKVSREEAPSQAEITRYKQEFDITNKIQLDQVARPLQLTKTGNRLVLIYADDHAESLRSIMADTVITLEEKIAIAIKSCAALGEIHTAQVIHKDINPANIIVDRTTGKVKIIDFGLATLLSREKPSLQSLNVLEGTLAYISPEQTGRMNRSVDYRTDIYSLGVLLYELFAGRLPFISDDPLELVHSHIAIQPQPMAQINPEIPTAISNIVLKLMAKTAEDRYQSAWGVHADLRRCLQQLQEKQLTSTFLVGTQDISNHFSIPQKLYGRSDETQRLLAAFDRVAGGGREFMLIAGYSALVQSDIFLTR